MITGPLLYGLLAMPPVAAWLEGSMVGHMLVQIPLLVLAGGLVARAAAGGRPAVLAGFNAGGIPGLLVAVFAAAVWMLPRMLDAALRSPLVEAVKFTTVPLLIGAPLALSWPLLPPIARGFVWANLTSHAAVLGWLYTVAPNRLCTRYLYDQQTAVGAALSVIATGLLVGWGWWAIVGRSITQRVKQSQPSERGPEMVGVLAMMVLPTAAVLTLVTTGAVAEDSGEAVFKKNCAVCHTVEPGKNKLGPSLADVVGRKAGSAPGYPYSAANKNSGDVWDEQTLDTYLTDPRKFMPGTKMVFAGLKTPEERKAVIEYLKDHP